VAGEKMNDASSVFEGEIQGKDLGYSFHIVAPSLNFNRYFFWPQFEILVEVTRKVRSVLVPAESNSISKRAWPLPNGPDSNATPASKFFISKVMTHAAS